jgi:sugar O-acyltransferase (sialic acid O-acetyltransferase NeuD family)
MGKKLVIFGAGDIAQLAAFYFAHDSDYEVSAFTVDRGYAAAEEAFGRPLVAFEEVERLFSPRDHEMFVALGYSGLNRLRRDRYETCKAKGYRVARYLSSRASVWPGFAPGENCFILEDNTLQPFARLGDNVTLWCGNHIGHHSYVGSHSFISSHVVISGGVEVGEQCFIGVNATVRDHVKIGARCVIGAGALIAADAAPDGVYAAHAAERSRVPSARLRRL